MNQETSDLKQPALFEALLLVWLQIDWIVLLGIFICFLLFWENLRIGGEFQVYFSFIYLSHCFLYCTLKWGIPKMIKICCYLNKTIDTDAVIHQLSIYSVLSFWKLFDFFKKILGKVLCCLRHSGCCFHFSRVVWVLLHYCSNPLKGENVFWAIR